MYANAKLVRAVDAALEPISLADAKKYLRVEHDSEDDLIGDLVTAARMYAEQQIERSFVTTTWRLTLDNFAGNPGFGSYIALPFLAWSSGDGVIRLPMPPLVEVQSISYTDLAGSSRDLDVATIAVSAGTPGEIAPRFGGYFPFTLPNLSAVSITYTAGYGDEPSSVPRNIVQAIRMLVVHFYEHRSINAAIPDAVVSLLNASAWGHYA